MKRTGALRWLAILALAWVGAMFVAYFVVHPLANTEVLLRLVRAVWALVLAALVLVLAGALGRRLIPQTHADPMACLAVEAAAGLGILSLALLAVGLAGLLHVWVLVVLLAVLLAWLPRSAWEWIKAWGHLPSSWRGQGRLPLSLAVMSGVLIACALAEALAPPVHFDALTYHLTLPQVFLDTGGLRPVADNPFWGLPLAGELLFTWVIGLSRPEAAAVLGVFIGVVVLAGVLGAARKVAGAGSAWVAVAVLLAGQTLAASLGWGYVDWLAALFGLALVVVLDGWQEAPDARLPWIAGAMAGFALGTKLTAGAAALAGAGMLVAASGSRRAWRALLAFGIAAAIAFAPWLIKNAWLAGTPLFPFYGPSPFADSLRQTFYREASSRPDLVRALLTPIAAVLQGAEGAPGFGASLGPLLLALLPGWFVLRATHRGRMTPWVVFLITAWILWAAAGLYSPKLLQSRLYYGVLPGWAIVAAAGYTGLGRLRLGRTRVVTWIGLLVAAALLLTTARVLVDTVAANPGNVIMGSETSDSYLGRRLGAFQPAMDAVARLGPEARVLSLWEPRAYYCLRVCSPDPWLDRWYLARREIGAPEQILQSWRQAGYTHLLLYRSGMDYVRQNDLRYSQADWSDLDRLVGMLTPVADISGAYGLYRLTP